MSRARSVLAFIARSGRRAGIAVAGFVLIAVGIVLSLPLVPGPGSLLIIAGLVVLATEYAWARRVLDRGRERARDLARRAGKRAPWRRPPRGP
ncbi:MAG TPA: PGPGW domain-containing protein [Actinomycetota bacterium]|nr:PGPGW domain-containing protein [Actinomycetota bacterium]